MDIRDRCHLKKHKISFRNIWGNFFRHRKAPLAFLWHGPVWVGASQGLNMAGITPQFIYGPAAQMDQRVLRVPLGSRGDLIVPLSRSSEVRGHLIECRAEHDRAGLVAVGCQRLGLDRGGTRLECGSHSDVLFAGGGDLSSLQDPQTAKQIILAERGTPAFSHFYAMVLGLVDRKTHAVEEYDTHMLSFALRKETGAVDRFTSISIRIRDLLMQYPTLHILFQQRLRGGR